MQLTHNYWWFKSIIDQDVCQEIIQLGKDKIEQQKAAGERVDGTTFGGGEKELNPKAPAQGEKTKAQLQKEGIDHSYIRDSEVTWFSDNWLYELIHPWLQEANQNAGWNFQWDFSEAMQFTVYKPGQFYGWHRDGQSDHFGAYKRYIHGVTPEPLKEDGNLPQQYVINPKLVGKVRKLSLTLNLTDPSEYDGGDLKFDFGEHAESGQFHTCEEIRPQGSMIVFPSFVPHCVTPVKRGTRYSLVCWSLGEPFK